MSIKNNYVYIHYLDFLVPLQSAYYIKNIHNVLKSIHYLHSTQNLKIKIVTHIRLLSSLYAEI